MAILLVVKRKVGDLYYRMSVYTPDLTGEYYWTIALAVSKSRRLANDFVKKEAVDKQKLWLVNKKHYVSTKVLIDMFVELVNEILKIRENVTIDLTGSDDRRTRVYEKVLKRHGFKTYRGQDNGLYGQWIK